MNRKTLVNALETLYPSVSTKPAQEEMGDFRIADNILRASDGLTQTQVTLPESTGLNLRIKADKFFRLLKGLSDDEITITVKGNDLTVKGTKSTAKYVVSHSADFLDSLDFDVSEWMEAPKLFTSALKLCLASASRDASRGVLTGVMVSKDWLIGSDGYRISRFPVSLTLDKPVVLSADLVKQISPHASKITGWAVKGDVAFFKIGDNAIVAGKLMYGDYPNVAPFFEETEKLTGVVELPDTIRSSLKRHLDQLGELPSTAQDVIVKLSGDTVTTISTDKVTFSLEETAKLEKAVDGSTSFKVHPSVLMEILDKTRAMKFGDEVESVLFEAPINEATFSYLACVEKA